MGRARLLPALAVVAVLAVVTATSAPAGAAWSGGAGGMATARATTIAPPGALTASCGLLLSNAVKLDWGASASAWAQYEVRWGTSNGGPYPNSSGVVTGLTYTTPGLGGGTHYFVVRAVKGAWASANSNQVSKQIITVILSLVCL